MLSSRFASRSLFRFAVAATFAAVMGGSIALRAYAGAEGTFSGIVSNGDSSIPLAGVAVVVYQGQAVYQRSQTDVRGRFLFLGLQTGTYDAYFFKDGLDFVHFAFLVCPGAQTLADPHMYDAPQTCGHCPVHRPPTPRIVGAGETVYTIASGLTPGSYAAICP